MRRRTKAEVEAHFFDAVDEYRTRFGEGPPLMQLSGGPAEIARLLRKCIRRGRPLEASEIDWPPPGAVSGPDSTRRER